MGGGGHGGTGDGVQLGTLLFSFATISASARILLWHTCIVHSRRHLLDHHLHDQSLCAVANRLATHMLHIPVVMFHPCVRCSRSSLVGARCRAAPVLHVLPIASQFAISVRIMQCLWTLAALEHRCAARACPHPSVPASALAISASGRIVA